MGKKNAHRESPAPPEPFEPRLPVSEAMPAPESSKRLPWIVFGFAFALLAVTLRDAVVDGFDGDALGHLSPATLEFAQHPWKPFMLKGDPGHPILFAWVVGLLYRVFGVTNALPHLATWVLSALLLTKVFELGEHAGGVLGAKAARATGVVAALLLFFHPMFISQAADYLSEMPNTAFMAAAALATLRGKTRAATVWLSLLLLTRLSGVATFGAFTVFAGILVLLGLKRGEGLRALIVKHVGPLFVSGLVFSTYLFVKLVVLKLPLTAFAGNNKWRTLEEIFGGYLRRVLFEAYVVPRMGLWVLLVVGAAGAIMWVFRADRPEREPQVSRDFRAAAALSLLGLVALANLAFYAANFNYPQPRYFLVTYPFPIVAGAFGLLVLSRARLAIYGPLVALWGGLLLVSWHGRTIAAVTAASPRLGRLLEMPHPPGTNLTQRDRIAYYTRLAGELDAMPERPLVFGLYPTVATLHMSTGGFVEEAFEGGSLNPFPETDALVASACGLRASRAPDAPILVVVSSWDVTGPAHRRRLQADPRFRLRASETPFGGSWAEVYELEDCRPSI